MGNWTVKRSVTKIFLLMVRFRGGVRGGPAVG